ncbi:MAG: WecB/TagA/CpsF family glycosyltransferase, partial [Alphaproteobacteria bacterium]|nr:WecB/TagA/CpsF family glycosyltransferase [Alphaproteobacteria bacterium]
MALNVPDLFFVPLGQQKPNAKHMVNVNVYSPEAILSYIHKKIIATEGFALATVNLDHLVKLTGNDIFLNAYNRHDVVVADGFPVVWLARLFGKKIVRTTGADLVSPIMKILEEENKGLALIGTTEDSLSKAGQAIKQTYPRLRLCIVHSPSFGFDPTSQAAIDLMKQVEESGASVCFLAFGAPKQEILAAMAKEVAPHVGFISVGAALDFIAGTQVRAPLWMQKANVEWLWRLIHNPRRLFIRYLLSAMIFPALLAKLV